MYAEDWVYAPAVAKDGGKPKATKDKIPLHEGRGEPLQRPHAVYAAQWAMTGGGALIRRAAIRSALLHLLPAEAKAARRASRPPSPMSPATSAC